MLNGFHRKNNYPETPEFFCGRERERGVTDGPGKESGSPRLGNPFFIGFASF